MQHLKECPWDRNTPWRPAALPMGTTSFDQREDLAIAKNLFIYGEMSPKVAQPTGLEETVRMAMKNRQGEFPRKEELRSASYLPNGWEDYKKFSKPDFTKSFSFIRNGCSFEGKSSPVASRPHTAGCIEEMLTPPAHTESLDKLATRTWSRMTERPQSMTSSMRMSASMPYIRAKSNKTMELTQYPLIRGLSREKAFNASVRF
ncbi:unnamed protein product [Effrenium voratum]|uniref:Uncharacterized protein n=1 Tax=Effrenium voratum TaxID=2562239 RepID=A0AA36N7F1_9DINO|nr:unnamed protein product [Effrenium voratum]CAJ1401735.1 unnamed protein product [Effrenium voratum]|mmetsp:Transcript_64177/g.153267  ORF Transcript_64177/g.153267 Transcript_64177/m.153267 type:complete len:203 (-) Transcript_64177:109-717(-)